MIQDLCWDLDIICVNVGRLTANCFTPDVGKVPAIDCEGIFYIFMRDRAILKLIEMYHALKCSLRGDTSHEHEATSCLGPLNLFFLWSHHNCHRPC